MAADVLELDVELRRGGRGEAFDLKVRCACPPGITVLFGPSGSGKSTVLQAVAGLVAPDRGRIAIGADVWFGPGAPPVPTQRRHLAYVFQSLALFPHLTAIGNVAYGIDRAVPRAERKARARALLERLHVGHLADRRPRTFSGGEAQRVALARAMARQPRVILLDEPFSALDRELRIELASEVRAMVQDLGVPAIFVTHNHGEIRALGDRVFRLERGKIVAEGTAEELLPVR